MRTRNLSEKDLLRCLEELRNAINETQSRIEELKRIISGRGPHEFPMVDETAGETRPAGCPHFFGYLKPGKNVKIDDACLTCPKLVECVKAKGHIEDW